MRPDTHVPKRSSDPTSFAATLAVVGTMVAGGLMFREHRHNGHMFDELEELERGRPG